MGLYRMGGEGGVGCYRVRGSGEVWDDMGGERGRVLWRGVCELRGGGVGPKGVSPRGTAEVRGWVGGFPRDHSAWHRGSERRLRAARGV